MANEKRLIDANALVKKFWQEECRTQTRRDFAAMVDYAPTVDAVEVVRCKDCKQWRRNIGFTDSPNGHCFYHGIDANGLDFCSCGERREGE